jgi:Pyruvate/2-oxoglutarate dehydrogenase complex, dehydrogenase (E1) component, eukaryotic type, beta subunit
MNLTMAKALNEGMRRAMAEDKSVLVMGEEVGQLGGVFRITEGLMSEFGPARVFDTPLADSGIVRTAIGLAMRATGQFVRFIRRVCLPVFDQITTQLASSLPA